MAQKNRSGLVTFGDASIHITEESLSGSHEQREAWERAFRREVFANIVQQLKRIGWSVGPWDEAEQFAAIANNRRTCSKGMLQGHLEMSGRCIGFEMWQSVNTPNRPDHGGRYEPNKEAVMPYLLRLEMERTRRRLRDYLCNVFDGYVFKTYKPRYYKNPVAATAMERIQDHYAESIHFKGDWEDYLAKERWMDNNRKSADGTQLNHGQRVWFFDIKGRINKGTAYYNINNMWWVVTGKYSYTNKACFDLHTTLPEDPRIKRNLWLRRKRLEQELAKAIKTMNFMRAETLRKIVYPTGEPLFLLKKGDLYHRPLFAGYTSNPIDAGKFTAAELKGITNKENVAVPLEAA